MKKRYRYLDHIPTYAKISFVDVEMNDLLRKKYYQIFKKDYGKKEQELLQKESYEL